jgi:hypothetical protein
LANPAAALAVLFLTSDPVQNNSGHT